MSIITEHTRQSKTVLAKPALAKVAMGLALVLLLILPYVTMYAQGNDPTIAALQKAGALHPLNLSQAADGITITLDWGYADLNQIALGLQIDGLDPQNALIPHVALYDATGNQFTPRSQFQGAYTFDAQPFATANSVQISLQLAAWLGEAPPDGTPQPSPTAPPAPFQFAFTLPLHPNVTVAPDLAITHNDITAVLEKVVADTTETTATVCYDLPDSRDWQPIASLTINGQTAQGSGWGMMQSPTPADTRRCFELRFAAPYAGTSTTLALTLEQLRTSEPETHSYWEAVQAELAKHDIVIDVVLSGGIYYELVSRPPDMADAEFARILREVRESLLPTIAGPWQFVVELG